ncbi:hypothetical protein C7S14_5382 [Burkholderia cepacia]|nr:hypothetical protein C7S14_5382 [Burkholderia cepacia]
MHDIPQRGRVTRYGERIDHEQQCRPASSRRETRLSRGLAQDLRALAIHAYAVGHRVPVVACRRAERAWSSTSPSTKR